MSKLSVEQETSIEDFVYENILNTVISECELRQGSKKYKKAIKYLIEILEKELTNENN